MTGLPQAVIALTVGHRLVAKLQALGRRDGRRRCRLALPGQDVEHDVCAAGATVERLGAGLLNRIEAVLQHRRQHRDELPVPVVVGREPGSQPAEGVGQLPVLEGCAVTQCAGLALQDRHVVPRLVGDLAASEAAGMLRNGLAVLADDDPIGVGPHVHRLPDRAGLHAVLVVVEAHQAGLGDGCTIGGVEAVEGAAVRHQERALLLEHLPHRLARNCRMRTLLGLLDAPILKPRVDLGVRPASRDGHEQAAADVAHLLLHLPLLPARPRRARHRLHQMVRAHRLEAAVVVPLLADKDRGHRRLHVVVDAPTAGPAEEAEGALVGLKDHLLAFAREDLNQLHPAVAEPHVRRLHPGRRARQTRVLVAPVELVGLAGVEAQRHVGLRWRQQTPPPAPRLGVAPHRVVAAGVAQSRKVLVDPQQRQPIPALRPLVGLKTALELLNPRPKLRHRLDRALVRVRGRIAPNHLAYRVPGNPQITGELLDRNALHQMIPTDPRNRLHNKHLPPPRPSNDGARSWTHSEGGQFWTPITPNRGSIFHA